MIMFNEPESIRNVSNKLTFFQRMQELAPDVIPPFWTNKEDIPDEDFPIVCRTVLAGHSGEGIVIANTRDELVDCSLYVKYIKKQDEYRIHVGVLNDGGTSIISQQRKARRADVDDPNWQIRNHANGFVFVRQNVQPPTLALDVAQRAMLASGLDFGAVDVIWNERQQRAYVLEINSAPGLEGTTIDDYVRYFGRQI
jgi:glutathione synthase/RimK-type ligase-like ATP-grasp enzyme